MSIRPDGSVASVNNPGIRENLFDVKDYGIHLGVVIKVIYTDDDANNESAIIDNTPREVLYDVLLVGGPRSGHVVYGASMQKAFAGTQNRNEVTLKPVITLTLQDLASPYNLNDIPNLNGDYVYVMFVGGNLRVPLITGLAKHPSDSYVEATSDEAQQLSTRFNGIETLIDLDGVFTWTKDNGKKLPLGADADGNVLIQEFVPVIPKAISLTVDNDFGINLKMTTGLTVSIDGTADSFAFGTAAGAKVEIDGVKDALNFATTLGTAINIAGGTEDSISAKTSGGAAIEIKGLSDEINLVLSSGTKIAIAPTAIDLLVSGGSKLSLAGTEASMLDITGAGFKVSNGLIALGNSSAELLDLISQAFQALSTQTAPGFGSPTSTVATFAQLYALIQTIKGSL